jgi:hypothetical protein
MKRVFSDADPVISGFVKSLLDSAGIECLIRNHYLGGGVGELPVNECWPEVWVLHDEDEMAACRIIQGALNRRPADGQPWVCAACGEGLEGQFIQCWNCGAVRAERDR